MSQFRFRNVFKMKEEALCVINIISANVQMKIEKCTNVSCLQKSL